MKILVKILLFLSLYFVFIYQLYAWVIICDSWDINLKWTTNSLICNWWFESNSIDDIDSFTWSFSDIDSWYWWSVNKYNKSLNIENNLPVWFFNSNKLTKVLSKKPNFSHTTWFLWTTNSLSNNINIEENLPAWFFNNNGNTKVLKTNLDYSFPIWYLRNNKFVKKDNRKWKKANNPIIEITYKEYLESIFKKSSRIRYKKWWYKYYEKSEYDMFIYYLVYLFSNWNNDYNKIISQQAKNRIEWYIENNPEFDINLWLLVSNLREINYAFEKSTNDIQKLYIIKYYLIK